MKDWPGAVTAITVVTDDIAATRAFYVNVFELEPFFEDGGSAVFKFGNTLLNVLQAAEAVDLFAPDEVGAYDTRPRVLFTLDVDNVDDTCARLADKGVTMINGPMDRSWGIRTASFRDPGGHVWEIAHPLK